FSGTVLHARGAYAVVVNWGDGTPAETFNFAAGTSVFSASHKYLDDNPTMTSSDVYPVSVSLTDSFGGTAASNTNITINNVPPSNVMAAPRSASINENDSITLSGSFTDPGTQVTHTVVIQWGDG